MQLKARIQDLKHNARFKSAVVEIGLMTYPFALKGLSRLAKSGAVLPPPIRLAILAAPYGIKLAVYGYGLHKAANINKTTI